MHMNLGLSKTFYLIVILIFIVFSYMYFFSSTESAGVDSGNSIEIKQGIFEGYEKGKKTYIVKTRKVIQSREKRKILLLGVNGSYFLDKGKIKVKASRAYLNNKTSYLKLIGDVKITGISGEVITSQEIFFNQRTKSVFSPVPIKIVAPLYKAEGNKMSGNVKRSYYRLVGNTKILIKKEAFAENKEKKKKNEKPNTYK
jgi:LPS export ABC transporter protein LptC